MRLIKSLITLLLSTLLTVAANVHHHHHHDSDIYDVHAIVNKVNSHPGTTWKAHTNHRFEHAKKSDIAALCGSKRDHHTKLPFKSTPELTYDIPTSFDARQQWSQCVSIGMIRDQSYCGDCWAVASVTAGSDRICIQANGTQALLSVEDLIGCSFGGCGGGSTQSAWDYFQRTGVVTGGFYGDYSFCSSYSLPPCAHGVKNSTYAPCPKREYPTPDCPRACDSQSNYTVAFENDHHKFATSYSVAANVTALQMEIMTNGPVTASYMVYEDFPSYQSGVYQHLTGDSLGEHAVKILGWGVDAGIPYWIVANSWNEDWGMKGFFHILQGQDECGIEGQVVAGMYSAQ